MATHTQAVTEHSSSWRNCTAIKLDNKSVFIAEVPETGDEDEDAAGAEAAAMPRTELVLSQIT